MGIPIIINMTSFSAWWFHLSFEHPTSKRSTNHQRPRRHCATSSVVDRWEPNPNAWRGTLWPCKQLDPRLLPLLPGSADTPAEQSMVTCLIIPGMGSNDYPATCYQVWSITANRDLFHSQASHVWEWATNLRLILLGRLEGILIMVHSSEWLRLVNHSSLSNCT